MEQNNEESIVSVIIAAAILAFGMVMLLTLGVWK